MSAEVVEGDLLNFDAKYIVHQTNCVSRGASGLAYYIFDKFPETNIYKERQEQNTIHIPGGIYTRKINDGKASYVINAMGQVKGGIFESEDVMALIAPGLFAKDGKKDRESYFSKCLDKMQLIKNLESIAFPWTVGCGIAGGDWNNYKEMIDKFADDLSDPNHPNHAKVYIVRRPGD